MRAGPEPREPRPAPDTRPAPEVRPAPEARPEPAPEAPPARTARPAPRAPARLPSAVRRSLRPRRVRRGAALIEFALLAPVLIGLLIGVIDAGWIFWQNAAMQVAVQDGCRDGAITDAGQDRVFLADIQRNTRGSVVSRLEGLGVACDDCEVAVDAVDVNGLLMLSCTMDRSAQSVAGLFQDLDLTTTTLTQMEVQR